MSCCGHFQKLMASYATRNRLREELTASAAEVRRLRCLLARVGVRDDGPEAQLPPDTRPTCCAQPCEGKALDGGLCAAHLVDEVRP